MPIDVASHRLKNAKGNDSFSSQSSSDLISANYQTSGQGDTDRVEPFSYEAEQAILGGIFINPDNLRLVLDVLKDETPFFYQKHRNIFRAMFVVASASASQQVDILSVKLELEKAQQDIAEKELKERLQHNSKSLVELYTLKDKMQTLSSQKELDEILSRIRQIDAAIDKEIFNQEQNNAYEDLTKSLTDLISTKMREFEKEKNIEYNKKAAESFALTFNQFRRNESKYRNQTQLFALVSTSLFAYDASRLFNETLIYYNHVYSYIFSKLDDDGKLALTRFSFDCERNRR